MLRASRSSLDGDQSSITSSRTCAGVGVGLEELQELVGNLLAPARAGMDSVAGQVLAFPDQAVALAGRDAVRLEIGPPQQERRLHRALPRVVVQPGFSLDLLLDQPAGDEGTLVGIRLGVQFARRVARVDPAAEVSARCRGSGGAPSRCAGRPGCPAAASCHVPAGRPRAPCWPA